MLPAFLPLMGWKQARSCVLELSSEFVHTGRQLQSNIITAAGHTQLLEPASPYTPQYSPAGKGHPSCADGILAINLIPHRQKSSQHCFPAGLVGIPWQSKSQQQARPAMTTAY